MYSVLGYIINNCGLLEHDGFGIASEMPRSVSGRRCGVPVGCFQRRNSTRPLAARLPGVF